MLHLDLNQFVQTLKAATRAGLKKMPALVLADQPEDDPEQEGLTQVAQDVALPKKYKVILLNDDFTPMDFVVYVLQRFFAKTVPEAEKVMLDVHNKGAGVAGVYSKEVAEMKVAQVATLARQNRYPLKCTMEEE